MKSSQVEIKAKALPLWIQLLGKLGINGAKSALEKRLKDGSPEEELVMAIADPLIGTINDLSDNEPENTQQVRSRWRKWLEVFMIPWLFRLIQPIVTKITAEYNRKMVQYLKDSSEKIALLLTDDIKPDNQQIDNFIDTEVAKPETKNLVITEFAGGNLLKAGLDEDLVAFLIEAANIGWDAITGKTQAQGVSVEVIAKGKIITLPSGRRATFYNQAA
jgi:hypothetical protein